MNHKQRQSPKRSLERATQLWFIVIVAGNLCFSLYIFGYYGRAAVSGQFEQWNRRLFRGLIEGDLIGNIGVALHLAMASMVSIAGPLQFIEKVRRRHPTIHRISGWIYILSAFAIGGGGLYLIAARGGVSITGDLSLGLNGMLIIGFAALALRCAIVRNFSEHRRWALRLFMAMNGFLFARAGFQAWIFLTGGFGHTKNYTGWFDIAWGFGSYLLPLAGVEFYLKVNQTTKRPSALAFSAAIAVASGILALGLALMATNKWIPALANYD